jgi:putative endonuclease
MATFYVYLLASHSRRLYTGVTSDLPRRVWEHKQALQTGHTTRYRINRLVYFEATPNARAAIEREKQLKRWTRARKFRLIERDNPMWLDLSEGWFATGDD